LFVRFSGTTASRSFALNRQVAFPFRCTSFCVLDPAVLVCWVSDGLDIFSPPSPFDFLFLTGTPLPTVLVWFVLLPSANPGFGRAFVLLRRFFFCAAGFPPCSSKSPLACGGSLLTSSCFPDIHVCWISRSFALSGASPAG